MASPTTKTRVRSGTRTAASPSDSDVRLLTGDCREILPSLPAGSIDMVFADPPYNLQLQGDLHRPNNSRVDGVDAAWDQFQDLRAYDRFTADWLAGVRHVLSDEGTAWVIGSYHNIYRVGAILQDLGFWILNDIVWRKTNPMPNFRGRRFCNAHETLLWVSKRKDARYVFNYEALKTANDDLQMRSDWVLPLCTGQERLKDPATGAKAHPTQKPESLLWRVLLASTRPGDMVLDPFFGTGTTGAVARRLGRRVIGIEADPDYVRLAEARLAAVEPLPRDLIRLEPARRSAPRIPFGNLMEAGLIAPGDVLQAPKGLGQAVVLSDARVRCGPHVGSIHKVGALLQDAPSCNGWTWWQVPQPDGSTLLLDELRAQMRRALALEA